MSWVMKITAMSWLFCSRRIRSSISAWVVTSSAVVGSSAISRCGSQASGHGDHHALTHPAREFESVAINCRLWIRDLHLTEKLYDPWPALDCETTNCECAALRRSGHQRGEPETGNSSVPEKSWRSRCPRIERISLPRGSSLAISTSDPSDRVKWMAPPLQSGPDSRRFAGLNGP